MKKQSWLLRVWAPMSREYHWSRYRTFSSVRHAAHAYWDLVGIRTGHKPHITLDDKAHDANWPPMRLLPPRLLLTRCVIHRRARS